MKFMIGIGSVVMMFATLVTAAVMLKMFASAAHHFLLK